MPALQTIHIHPNAPAKPEPGATCNGCGVCCLAEPCPLGVLWSRRCHGACTALRWSDEHQRYLCGALAVPWLAPLARRWIAAGQGCDATLSVDNVPP